MAHNYNDIFKSVTARVIKGLEDSKDKGWKRPWVQSFHAGAPVNVAGRPYRGMNVLLLSLAMSPTNVFGSRKTWAKLGCTVNEDATKLPVIFWKFSKKTRVLEDGSKEQYSTGFARDYEVFSADQVTGAKADGIITKAREAVKLPAGVIPDRAAESLVSEYLAGENMVLKYGGNRAYYSPRHDCMQLPEIDAFKTTEGYYSTLLHEVAHSTGHKNRLARDFGGRFGGDTYAFEELVAELSSTMTCAAVGIEDHPHENHIEYVKSWLKVLRRDEKAIITAASQAQKASDYVLAYTGEKKVSVAA